MSRTGRTNQVLYFARLSLDKVEQAESLQDKQMMEETALYHLHTAFISLVSEVLAQYNLEPFVSIDELFSRSDLPAELHELQLAKLDSKSWLYNLLKQKQRMIIDGLKDNNVNSGLISSQSDYTSLFRNYLKEIENLAQRIRVLYQWN
ncbi:MAG: hypothetical protein ACJA0E_001211 [Bermanella sp.]|jgi:hypothetical protein